MKQFTTCLLCEELIALRHQLKEVIIKIAEPDMIFILGVTLQHKKFESIFSKSSQSYQQLSDCTLLILITNLANKELHDWQDKIENHCSRLLPVTTLVLATSIFVEWLQADHSFACFVSKHAPVLYDAENVCMSDFSAVKEGINDKETSGQLEEGFSKAKEFLAGAELYRVRKQHKMAAFMLHQSAEQALRALLKTGTGYHANTHSIDRLLRYGSLVAHQLSELFPRQTEQDRRLLTLLQKAYIDTRYKEDYKITDEELRILADKIRRIHDLFSDVGKSFLNTPSQPAPLSTKGH